ncbi:uncharacterized protein LOC134818820 [Bolinopsis microptera]|uniref:uncharacterized protein LOC134818820 n=1 Tax=Bolinopsis microptera TaxID=2820187 RepID=UPI00307952D3
MFLNLLPALLLLTATFGGSLDNKWEKFCDIKVKSKDGSIKCCKAKAKGYIVHVGVCDGNEMFKSVIGYNALSEMVVTPDEATSDHSAKEDNPGKDEGICHVYKTYIGGVKACIPGNMVTAAKFVHQWLESDGIGQCSMDLGYNCKGEPDHDTHYDFAIKLNLGNAAANLFDLKESLGNQKDLNDSYECKIEVKNGDYYVVCPL